jgi:hypothetical protein
LIGSYFANFLSEILPDPFKYHRSYIFQQKKKLIEKKRKECMQDDLDRMGSSPADSRFINNQLLQRMLMMVVLS